MKITRTPKRLAEARPEIKGLIQRIETADDEQLPAVVDSISEWCWPRGDLFYWVPTLNRFDNILEETCRDYDLQKLQINEFTPSRKRLLVAVLRFTRLLIENCMNRKLYASFEHLNNLLFTRDLDVLEATLRLLMRPAQHNSAMQAHSRYDMHISQERLATLAVTWAPRSDKLDLVDMATDDAVIPPEHTSVRFQFYRRHRSGSVSSSSGKKHEGDGAGASSSGIGAGPSHASTASAGPSSSSQNQTAAAAATASSSSGKKAEGLVTIDLGRPAELGHQSPVDVLADAIEAHDIPESDHFELFQKIRLAMLLPDPAARRQLLVCRLLAIATYAHTCHESKAVTQLFLYEPDIIPRTAALVDPARRMSEEIVSSALYALDALGRYKSKLGEVLASLHTSVNHGILLHLLRQLIDDVRHTTPTTSSDFFVDALFGLLSFITSTSHGNTMVVGAGLVQLLVQLVQTGDTSTYMVQRTVTRAIGLIDTVIYTNAQAFTLYCQAHGPDIFVNRIKDEVQTCIEMVTAEEAKAEEEGRTVPQKDPDAVYGKLSFGRANLLRQYLKSITHMMSTAGTADGLRNLIDGSLPDSIRTMMDHRRIFGPQAVAYAINVMATLVHNEPTSLGVMQEKKLPEAFLRFVNEDIEASYDVICAIPNAVGALCLNQAGLDMFSASANNNGIVARLFELLTSERHTAVLQDRDNASAFGAAVDELVRHQPTMKQPVMDGILAALKRIQDAGNSYEPPAPPPSQPSQSSQQTQQQPGSSTKTIEMGPFYRLERVEAESGGAEEAGSSSSSGAVMTEGQNSSDQALAAQTLAMADSIMDDADVLFRPENSNGNGSNNSKQTNNAIIGYIDVTARFLESLFQSSSHCKDFLKADGLDRILGLYALPCLPHNFAATLCADSVVTLLRTIAVVNIHTVMSALLREVKRSIDETRSLFDDRQDKGLSSLAPLASYGGNSDDSEEDKKQTSFRLLVRLQARVQLLADVAPSLTYSSSKSPAALLQPLNGDRPFSMRDMASINDLGELHRAVVWEHLLLKAAVPSAEALLSSKATTTTTDSSVATEASATPATAAAAAMTDGSQEEKSGEKVEEAVKSNPSQVRYRNALAVRYLMAQLSHSLSAFLIDVARNIASPRRAHEVLHSAHRRLHQDTAAQMAKVVQNHVQWRTHPNMALSCSYATTMLAHIASLLYGPERAGHHADREAHSLILNPFVQRENGVDVVTTSLQRCFEELQRHYDADSDGRPREATSIQNRLLQCHSCNGVREALLLLRLFVSSGPLINTAASNAIVSSPGTARDSRDYFQPRQLLIQMRERTLVSVNPLWKQALLVYLPSDINHCLLEIYQRVATKEGEEEPPKAETASSAAPAAGVIGSGSGSGRGGASGIQAALAGLTGALAGGSSGGNGGSGALFRSRLGQSSGETPSSSSSTQQPQQQQQQQPDEDRVRQLAEMGFPRRASIHALQRFPQSVNAATEYLLLHPGLMSSMADDEETPTPASASAGAESSAPANATTEQSQNESQGGGQQEQQESATAATSSMDEGASSSTNAGGAEEDQPADAEQQIQAQEQSGEAGSMDWDDAPIVALDARQEPTTTEETAAASSATNEASGENETEMKEEASKDVQKSTKSTEERLKEADEVYKASLERLRNELLPGLFDRALQIADHHKGLVFDVRDIVKITTKDSGPLEVLRSLFDQVATAASNDALETKQQDLLDVRLHLLALLFDDLGTAVIDADSAKSFMQSLVSLLAPLEEQRKTTTTAASAATKEVATTSAPGPKWTASFFLVLSGVLSIEEDIREVAIAKKEDAAATSTASSQQQLSSSSPTSSTPSPVREALFADVWQRLFACTLTCLSHAQGFTSTDLTAIYRFLVVLSRKSLALPLFARDGLKALLKPFATLDSDAIAGCQVLAVIVLRHVVESESLLRSTMTHELRAWLGRARAKTIDTSSFSLYLGHSMLRHSGVFFDVLKDNMEMVGLSHEKGQGYLQLSSSNDNKKKEEGGENDALSKGKDETMMDHDLPASPTKPSTGNRAEPLSLMPSAVEGGGGETAAAASSATKGKEKEREAASSSTHEGESLDVVMHFLLSELLKTSRDRNAQLESRKRTKATSNPTQSTQTQAQAKGSESAMDVDETTANAAESEQVKKQQEESNREADKNFFYTCFLLQAITELVSSYMPCKTSLLNFSKRKLLTPYLNAAASSGGLPILSAGVAGAGLGIASSAGTLQSPATPGPASKETPSAKTPGTSIATPAAAAATPSAATTANRSAAILSFFLTDLVPISFVHHCEQDELRKLVTLSNLSMSVIVALCADVVYHADAKDAAPDVVLVRKAVLDGLAKALRDTSSSSLSPSGSEHVEVRYGRMFALSDLCYRLLTAHPNVQVGGGGPSSISKQYGDLSLHMAKTMLEKGFVNVLTNALAEVDLNLATVKPLLVRILKPLEHLTKVAIKVNKAARKGASNNASQDATAATSAAAATSSSSSTMMRMLTDGLDSDDQDTDSDEMSDEDGEDHDDDDEDDHRHHHHHHHGDEHGQGSTGARDETPDFYRNSSLGMHTGELETGQPTYDGDEDDDEDEDMDDDDDVDMEVFTDSEEHSEDSDEDDDIEEHIVEVMEEEDDDDEDGEEDEDDEDEDSDEDIEIMDADGNSWVDEDEEGNIEIDDDDEDDDEDEDDEDDDEDEDDDADVGDGEDALDFVLDGDGRPLPRHFFDEVAEAAGRDAEYVGGLLDHGDGAGGHIDFIDAGEDEDEDGEELDDDEDASLDDMYDQEELSQLDFEETMLQPHAHPPPHDRFGADWAWTNGAGPAAGGVSGDADAAAANAAGSSSLFPPAFILNAGRPRAGMGRHNRPSSAALMGFPYDVLGGSSALVGRGGGGGGLGVGVPLLPGSSIVGGIGGGGSSAATGRRGHDDVASHPLLTGSAAAGDRSMVGSSRSGGSNRPSRSSNHHSHHHTHHHHHDPFHGGATNPSPADMLSTLSRNLEGLVGAGGQGAFQFLEQLLSSTAGPGQQMPDNIQISVSADGNGLARYTLGGVGMERHGHHAPHQHQHQHHHRSEHHLHPPQPPSQPSPQQQPSQQSQQQQPNSHGTSSAVSTTGQGASSSTDVNSAQGNGGANHSGSNANSSAAAAAAAAAATKQTDPVELVQMFVPQPTATRWSETARVIHGSAVNERTARLRNHVINALMPAYDLRQAKQLEAKRKEHAETIAKLSKEIDEMRTKVQSVKDALTKLREEEKVEREALEMEQKKRRETEEAEQARVKQQQAEQEERERRERKEATGGDDDDVDMDDQQQAMTTTDAQQQSESGATAMQEGESQVQEQAASATPARITTTVNGREVDITDTGIDPTFLEALPDDMREEVLNQHFRERRAAASTQGAETNIAPEFLDALPPEIRAEVIQQEALENENRRRAAAAAAARSSNNQSAAGGSGGASGSGNTRGPAQMDNASFLASLNPDLRNSVLMESDPTYLEGLPSDMVADLNELRQQQGVGGSSGRRALHRRFDAAGNPISSTSRHGGDRQQAQPSSSAANGSSSNNNQQQQQTTAAAGTTSTSQQDQAAQQQQPRDAIQLLDKSGVATLVRLLFFPQIDSRHTGLHKVLVNLAENSKTRTELLNLLLGMLAEGTHDVGSVDKSYAQMSVRVSKAAAASTTSTANMQTPERPAPALRRHHTTPAAGSSTASQQQQAQGGNAVAAAPATPTTPQVHFAGSGFFPSTPGNAGAGASAAASHNSTAITTAPLSKTGEEAPFLIASRTIETLLHLTSYNEQAALHFLRDEVGQPVARTPRKGKAAIVTKGAGTTASHSLAPINVLLALLAKPSILGHAQLVDSLIALLNIVTKPLPAIVAKKRQAEEQAEKERQSAPSESDKDKDKDKQKEKQKEGEKAVDQEQSQPGDATATTSNTAQGSSSTTNTTTTAAADTPAIPSISGERMAAVVRPLATSISSKGFQHTLAVASNLSSMSAEAKETIQQALQREAEAASRSLIADLDHLLETLPPVEKSQDGEGDEEDNEASQSQVPPPPPSSQAATTTAAASSIESGKRIESPALNRLASPSSSQTVILRSLRALEWVVTRPSKTAASSSSTSNSTTANGNGATTSNSRGASGPMQALRVLASGGL